MAMKCTSLVRSAFKMISSGSEQVSGVGPLRCVSTSVTRFAEESWQASSSPTVHREKCMNQVSLLGRVGRDPEKRGTDEKSCMVFSIATNSFYKEDGHGNYEQRTDWHRVAVFRPNVRDSVEKYMRQGARVLVTGRIMYDSFHDASGVRHKTTTILADNIYYLASGRAAVDGDYEETKELEAADQYLKVKEK